MVSFHKEKTQFGQGIRLFLNPRFLSKNEENHLIRCAQVYSAKTAKTTGGIDGFSVGSTRFCQGKLRGEKHQRKTWWERHTRAFSEGGGKAFGTRGRRDETRNEEKQLNS
jgi:hypothetical protein